MNHLGTFIRIDFWNGAEWDVTKESGEALLAKWREVGPGVHCLTTVTSITNHTLFIDLASVASLYLSTPESRQAVRERNVLFDKENAENEPKEWEL